MRIQVLRVAPLATHAGVDAAIPLSKMHEQFCPLIEADHDGHEDGRVLSEPGGFGQQQLLELLDDRVDFHERRRGRIPGVRLAGLAGWSLHRAIPGLSGRCEAVGLGRSWRYSVGAIPFPALEACALAVRQCFHAKTH